jgi:hypothetical protein
VGGIQKGNEALREERETGERKIGCKERRERRKRECIERIERKWIEKGVAWRRDREESNME